MKHLVSFTVILVVIFLSWSQCYKLVCYYDMTSSNKVGPAKFTSKDMELALQFCTHVIYSYVTINPKQFTLTVGAPERERELSKMIKFKNKHPNVKFLLSISGKNNPKTVKSFLNLLENPHNVEKHFIKSAMGVLTKYKFDGFSLDLPLPTVKPKTEAVETYWGMIWHSFAHYFKSDFEKDSKESEHKHELTSLIQKLSANLRERNCMLTLNVLPNVDSKKYFNIVEIIKNLDFVILSAFDFYTPERNPTQANLMSPTKPLKQNDDDLTLTNIKTFYKYWHSQGVPRYKIIVGVAAYGRTWKMTKNSNSNGIPPVCYTDGPAAPGPQTFTPGFLSWPEICEKLSNDHKFIRVTDPKAKNGVYAFRPADNQGNFGIWISYEDPKTIAAKAEYTRNHNLGGVALVDLSLDDVHGECSGEKFPMLKTIKSRLSRGY